MWDEFKAVIASAPFRGDDDPPLEDFAIWHNHERHVSCYYAPFDHVNRDAQLVLVGITPGGTQMNRALNAAREALSRGGDVADSIRRVKRIGSFSGAMRPNIVNTLNRLGYAGQLGIASAAELFSDKDHLVHFCSLLRYPVFYRGKDYSGNPNMLRVPELTDLLEERFVAELQEIDVAAELVPLGDTVGEVIERLYQKGKIPQKIRRYGERLVCPPHPSGSNAESIALIMRHDFPDAELYEEQKYRKYLRDQPWTRRRGGKPQSEEKYKKTRRSRWEVALFIREAYGVK